MPEKIRQHVVPQVYLKPFCDPDSPPGHPTGRPYEPAVWLLDKSLATVVRRAPKNVLWESSVYTLRSDDPGDPVIEHVLSELESGYAHALRTLVAESPLTEKEWINLLVFVGALHYRTRAEMAFQQRQVDHIQAVYRMVDRGTNGTERYSDEFWAGADEAAKRGVISLAGPFARRLHAAGPWLLVNDTEHQFITADNPVVVREVHIDELREFEFPPEVLRQVGRNERAFFYVCALTPRFALVASRLLMQPPTSCMNVPASSRLGFWMNLIICDCADQMLIAANPRPFGAVQSALPVLEASLAADASADTSRPNLIVYSETDRYSLAARDMEVAGGSNPLVVQLRFRTSDLDQLRAIAAAERLVEIAYTVGDQHGGMRGARFTEVAIAAEGDSVIESVG